MIPARYQIRRQMQNYLQYILLQPSNSVLARVFVAQKNNPTRGDWVNNIFKHLADYNIKVMFWKLKSGIKAYTKVI